ncbi:MAG TPA: hypothetical protein VHC63_01860 [Acidimicrobiales bacterium]|nr:hypothetical protein [Acidimicrobiales bacterium]
MTPEEAAVASADAVRDLTSRFMLDAATYMYGASIGFPGASFYAAGRGGVLGDVDSEVVTEAFVFFHPDNVKTNWEGGADVMPRAQAALEFMQTAARWGEEHLPDDVDCARLAELAHKVSANADGFNAPIFEGWRRMTPPDTAKAAAVFHMNSLRELRFAIHAQAILGQGIAPEDALRHRQPHMVPMFGWGDPTESSAEIAADWNAAEDETNAAFAKALSVLTSDELDEFVALANAANDATA